MTTTRDPIWVAALMAAECSVESGSGPGRVAWKRAPDHLFYVAAKPETIQPFGIRLSPGNVCEVRWFPGDTGYTVCVHPSQGAPA